MLTSINLRGLMGTSARTLPRGLTEHETSFQSLLAEVQRDLALRHLAQGNSVTDTAFLLGFSEVSAFSRAFRRWTGRAPRAYVRHAGDGLIDAWARPHAGVNAGPFTARMAGCLGCRRERLCVCC